MNDYLALLAGIACAGIGGELFVRGTMRLAAFARVSPGIVAATVAAFATSGPELSVAVNAGLAGQPQVSLGNVLGANIVDVTVVLGIALVMAGLHVPRDSVRRDFPAALAVPLLVGALSLDGLLSRLDAALMMALFALWFVAVLQEARRERRAAPPRLDSDRAWEIALICAGGLLLLVFAGRLLVDGARGIALSFGLSDFVIGASVVAIGTTIPELATTVTAVRRGANEIGLGTVLGSVIFNGLFIVSVAAFLHPVVVAPQAIVVALAFGVLAVALVHPGRGGFLGRGRGVVLLAVYAVYVLTLLATGASVLPTSAGG